MAELRGLTAGTTWTLLRKRRQEVLASLVGVSGLRDASQGVVHNRPARCARGDTAPRVAAVAADVAIRTTPPPLRCGPSLLQSLAGRTLELGRGAEGLGEGFPAMLEGVGGEAAAQSLRVVLGCVGNGEVVHSDVGGARGIQLAGDDKEAHLGASRGAGPADGEAGGVLRPTAAVPISDLVARALAVEVEDPPIRAARHRLHPLPHRRRLHPGLGTRLLGAPMAEDEDDVGRLGAHVEAEGARVRLGLVPEVGAGEAEEGRVAEHVRDDEVRGRRQLAREVVRPSSGGRVLAVHLQEAPLVIASRDRHEGLLLGLQGDGLEELVDGLAGAVVEIAAEHSPVVEAVRSHQLVDERSHALPEPEAVAARASDEARGGPARVREEEPADPLAGLGQLDLRRHPREPHGLALRLDPEDLGVQREHLAPLPLELRVVLQGRGHLLG
mmetsp:Transcript_93745/g.262235  ORF Transcript_93745/g.262235 Transcript_93745/m.262235 type:complete len:441 (+) Transcript_93745:609-1931(+)